MSRPVDDHPSDVDLIHTIKNADWEPDGREAAGKIWTRHERMIRDYIGGLTYRCCPRWVDPESFRDELPGAVAEKLLRTNPDGVPTLATYDGHGSFEGYLKRVCATTAIDQARRAGIRNTQHKGIEPRPGDDGRPLDAVADHLSARSASGPVTVHPLDARKLWNALRTAVRGGLHRDKARALRMDADGYTSTEIAIRFQKSERTIQRWNGEAILSLRTVLHDQGITRRDDL